MFASVFFEIVLILILVFGSYIGYKKGLFVLVAKPLSFLACLWISFSFYVSLGDRFVAPLIGAPVKSYLNEYLTSRCGDYCTVGDLPTIIKISAVLFDLPIENLSNNSLLVTEISDRFADQLILTIGRAVGFVFLLLLSRMVLKSLIKLVSKIFDVSIIGKINRGFGVVLSGLFAFVVAWGVVSLTDYLFRLGDFSQTESAYAIMSGKLYVFFASLSPLKLLFSF